MYGQFREAALEPHPQTLSQVALPVVDVWLFEDIDDALCEGGERSEEGDRVKGSGEDLIFDDVVGVEGDDVVDFVRELSWGFRFVLFEFDDEVGDVCDVEQLKVVFVF